MKMRSLSFLLCNLNKNRISSIIGRFYILGLLYNKESIASYQSNINARLNLEEN